MKRQGLRVTIRELENLIKELSQEDRDFKKGLGIIEEVNKDKIWLISIINKEEKGDTWELEK